MKVVIVGYGEQGRKRKRYLGKECVATVDNKKNYADYDDIRQVPISCYNTVFLCVPDKEKLKIINYCLKQKKNILVEKPLIFNDLNLINKIEKRAKAKDILIYTAYNHRFEPHIIKLKKIIKQRKLGRIYYIKLFYGNGTAKNVKKNKWRDKNFGVLSDLGSHLLDIVFFVFGYKNLFFKLISKNSFENNASDHAIIYSKKNNISISIEVSYCMWKNDFSIDVIGKKGSAHLKSLSKWKNSKIVLRQRVLPSGKPKEKVFMFSNKDLTWKQEHFYFKKNILLKRKTNLSNDLQILRILKSSYFPKSLSK